MVEATASPPATASNPVLVRQIPLKHLSESKLNPRKTFEGVEELAASIKEQGILVPLIVRSMKEGFEILAGARRFRASKLAGLEEVPCRIIAGSVSGDTAAIEVILTENLQRVDVHPMEEADVFAELHQRLGFDMDALAMKLSKPRSFLRQRLQLVKLMPEARKLFESHRITLDGAMQIARLQQGDQKEVVGWFKDQGITTGRLRDMIEDHFMLKLKGVPWKMDDAKLCPKAGACLTCPKRTGTEKDLFADMAKEGDRCTDRACFIGKAEAYLELRKASIEAGGEKVKFAYAEWTGNPKKGVLTSHEWRATKKGTCENTVPLLLLEFKTLGKLVYGCTAKDGCKKCGGGTRESSGASDTYQKQQKKLRVKMKFEKELRGRVLKEVLEKSKETGDVLLRRILLTAFDRLWHQASVDLCRFLAWNLDPEFTPGKSKYGGVDTSNARAKIASAGPGTLQSVALALAFAGDLGSHNDGGDLKGYAKTIGVDIKALEKIVTADLAKKKSVKAAKPKADKAKATKAAKAKK
jgi:ParB family chromosome partitioning protein